MLNKLMSQPVKKAVSLLMTTALLATSVVFVNVRQAYASDDMTMAALSSPNYGVSATVSGGAVLPGTRIDFRVTTDSAIILVSSNGGVTFEPRSSYTIDEPGADLQVKASKAGLSDSGVEKYSYSVPSKVILDEIKNKKAKDIVRIEGVVTAIMDSRTMYVRDSSGGLKLYNKNEQDVKFSGYKVGDVLASIGEVDIFNEVPQLALTKAYCLKKIGAESVSPQVKKLSELKMADYGQLVTIKNVEITKDGSGDTYKLKDDSVKESVTMFGKYAGSLTRLKGRQVESITGVVSANYGKIQIEPRSKTDIIIDSNMCDIPTATLSNWLVKSGDQIELKSEEAGAVIKYEVGSELATTKEPSNDSAIYNPSEKIKLDGSIKVIKAIVVKDGKKNSEVAVFEFAYGLTRISDIQGKSHYSLYDGKSVYVGGYVIGYNDNGFYIQGTGLEVDSDPETSDAVFIKTESKPSVKLDTYVNVFGSVEEKVNAKKNLPVTQINALQYKTSKPVKEEKPVPVIIGLKGRVIPSNNLEDDNFTLYEPNLDALDFYESLENMLVKIEKPLVTASYTKIDEETKEKKYVTISVLPDSGDGSKSKLTSINGIKLTERSVNPELIQIGDSLVKNLYNKSGVPYTGDQYQGDIQGVLTYEFGIYRVNNNKELPAFSKNSLRVREVTDIVPDPSKITVASYNIENFSAATGMDRVGALADTMIGNLKTPDIIGLLEVQDDNGPKVNDGDVDATKTLNLLTSTINQKTNGMTDYDFVQINPENNKDGGQPGANIRVAFIYNKKRVSLAPGKKGDAITDVKIINGHLSHNPGRVISTDKTTFEETRKSLAAEFIFNGESVIVIANHFSSKSGSDPALGSVQPPQDPVFERRTKQGSAVNALVKDLMRQNPKANVLALGDLNAFEFETATRNLMGKELVNLFDKLPENERYSYVYNGSCQVLDHLMVSKHLYETAEFDPVHINALFTDEEGSVSDHDPVLAQLTIPKSPKTPSKDKEDKPSKNTGTVTPSTPTPTPTQPTKPVTPATDNKAADAAKEKAKATGKLTEAEKTILKEAIKTELKAQATSNNIEDRKQLKENIAILNKVLGNVEAKQELLANPEALSKAITTSVENLKKELAATGLSEKTAKPVVTLESTTEKISVSLQAADLKVAKANGADFKVATADASVKVANADLNEDKAYKVVIEKDASLKGTAPKQMAAITEGVKLDTEFKTVQLAIPVDAAKAKTLGVFKLDEAKKTYVLVKSQMDAATGSLIVNDASNGQYVVAEVKTAFADTTKTWAKDTIAQVSARGIMVGLAEDKFAPEKTVTKAEFAAALLNVIGKADPNAKDWKASSVAAANQLGFGANFLNDKTADKAITREEMAYMMAKAYALKAEFELQASTLNFKDAKNVNKALQGEVAKAQELGLVRGMADGSFKPASTGTRAEAAQMLLNLASNL